MARGGGGLDPVQAEMVEPPVNADTLSSMKVRRDLRPAPPPRCPRAASSRRLTCAPKHHATT